MASSFTFPQTTSPYTSNEKPTTTYPSTKTKAGMWAFDRSSEWVNRYGQCSNKFKRTAPLNIDTNNISPCSALCKLSVKYAPTTCNISMVNNIPTVTFTPNCYIKFRNDFFYLRKMTIHYTSMHTVNESYYDLEVLLYHNRNPINDSDGGVILSILMKKGNDFGGANQFMNEFINQMPANEMAVEKEVEVSDNWNPEQLFPESKSFFYYEGALPYPPCNPNWTIIVFEEPISIAQNIIDTVKYILGPNNKNIRPVQRKPRGIKIFYNASSGFDSYQDMSGVDTLETKPTLPEQASIYNQSWLKRNIYRIKGILITVILIMMIYVAIRFASIIVKNDLLNSFIIRQLKKKESRQGAVFEKQMANQQSMEFGGIAPPTQTKLPNNNNNNNN